MTLVLFAIFVIWVVGGLFASFFVSLIEDSGFDSYCASVEILILDIEPFVELCLVFPDELFYLQLPLAYICCVAVVSLMFRLLPQNADSDLVLQTFDVNLESHHDAG